MGSDLSQLLQKTVATLQHRKIQFCLAGGLVASLYRNTPRLTQDIDIVVLAARDEAQSVLEAIGFKTHPITRAKLEGGPLHERRSRKGPILMICSDREQGVAVDLILPEVPWVPVALDRAQTNSVDFGFGPLPCLTVEDLILSKLYALKNRSDRFQDLDDLKNIFETHNALDVTYLLARMRAIGLTVPTILKSHAPRSLGRV